MSSITHPGTEPPDADVLEICRLALKLTWQTALMAGAIVLVLSMHSGAALLTAGLRSVATMGVLGLIGWSIGAFLLMSNPSSKEDAPSQDGEEEAQG
ncbi:MAG TPA: hypothetical protein GX702_08575 [Chloroflexi bacterium]|jgi:hypothetical protein|nr:hypothetical protein [Chloroflexota bacterium]